MAEDASKEAPKKKGKLKWILVGVVLLLLLGGGYFAYIKFFAAPAEEGAEQSQTAQPKGPRDAQTVTLPTFLVNLADPLGRRYLKLTMDVEVDGKQSADNLQKNMPKVRDALILLLSSKTYSDLASLESKQLLKMEIVNQLNLILETSGVLQVYFTELVIQ